MTAFMHLTADLLTFGLLALSTLEVARRGLREVVDEVGAVSVSVVVAVMLMMTVDEGIELGGSATDWVQHHTEGNKE